MYEILSYQEQQNLYSVVYTAKLIDINTHQDILAAVSLKSREDAIQKLKTKAKKLLLCL